MKKGKNAVVIILFAMLLMLVTFLNAGLVFRMTSQQTRDMGGYQLESISRELENTINNAEKLTMRIGITAERYLGNYQAISDYIYEQVDELEEKNNGAFNVYIAGKDWNVLPGLADPDNFDATKRDWYTGAIKNKGETYVTSPYTDVVTGEMCYTVSLMLADGETVIAVDYTMNTIQDYINRMYNAGSSNAIILTGDGIIIGCSDDELVGSNISEALPEYVRIFSLAKNNENVVTGKIKKNRVTENLFATKSNTGWYLIIGESSWMLYKESYVSLMITVGLLIGVFVVIIALYMLAIRNQKNAEYALNTKNEFLDGITGDLQEPLNRILESSGKASVKAMEDYEEVFARIHSAGEKLSEMIRQIASYSSIVRTEKKKNASKKVKLSGLNKNVRNLVLLFMLIVMVISFYTNISATYRWGNEMMQREVANYEYQVSTWVNTQKDLLDMFCSEFSVRPEMLDDYDETIAYLNEVTSQYPEISASYMANPELEPSVYMNNGWTPEPGWHVEERPWYIATMNSESGWSISAPYYDDQTGGYCITISQRVYSSKTGEFLGIFGIDFFMDKLVDILGGSYSDTGYAFLVDPQGEIINHPYGNYQMSQDTTKNVADSPYDKADVEKNGISLIKDYDKSIRILAASENKETRFSVYVVASVWKIYGKVFIYGAICLIAFFLAIITIYRLLSNLINWQNETNKQLQESTDEAIAAGKAKSQFLAQMSHEIRTPINAVLGMNEMILRESEDKEILEYSANIQSAGRTLLSIINSILDFSKIEDGKMEIIQVKYDIAGMINNLVNSIQERAKAKGLEFNVDVDEKLPTVLMGDDVRITQVIMNLLTNAVKYTEKGSVTLSISSRESIDDVDILEVKVSDTGIGIREEDMDKLFESFERIDEKRNRNIEGTGLGMAIVTKLLAMMDSKLEVESVYGKGSTFSFVLRQHIVDETPIGDYAERLAKNIGLVNEKKALYAPDARLLVVDDNDMNIKVAKSLMKLNGIVPDTCMSGEECINKLRNNTYDIVFLDHMMPKMDGMETLKHIQEENLKPEGMYIIALTANAINGAKEKYLSAGFDDYISKPIEIPNLEGILRRYLSEEKISYKSVDSKGKNNELSTFLPNEQDNSENAYGDISELPVIDGLDWRYASDHLPTVDFIIDTVNDFRKVMMSHVKKLDSFYKELPDEEAMNAYRIQVHAMKSSAATIGIIPLAGMAKVLEDAAAKKNEDKIRKMHDVFCDEWIGFKERLMVLGDDGSGVELKEYDKEKTDALLNQIKEAMGDFDIDSADAACKELSEYSFPDELREKIEEISIAVTNVDDETAISIIDQIL